jgi:hypothetical protein
MTCSFRSTRWAIASLSCGEKIGTAFPGRTVWRISTMRTMGIFLSSARSGNWSSVYLPLPQL